MASALENGKDGIVYLEFANCIYYTTALYNFYAASEVDEASLHKACTKSVGFFCGLVLSAQKVFCS